MKAPSRRIQRLRRTPEQIRIILEEYEQGSKGAHEFAAEQNIAVSTLWAWRRRYGVGSTKAARPRFVEVSKESIAALGGATAQIRFPDGLTVQLSSGFAVEPVAQLVQRLRQA